MEETARRWVAGGHRVTIFCAVVAELPEREIVHGVEIVRRGSRFSVYREARRFWSSEGPGNYDVVVDCINTKPFAASRFVKHVPVVAFAHQVAREVWWYEAPFPAALVGRFVLEPMWLRGYRDVPVLTVSDSSRRSLERYGVRKVTVVPEGIDPPDRHCTYKKCSVPTLAFCGRLVRSKRPAHAIAAFAAVRRELPDARLVVIGSGPLEQRLRAHAPEGVTFTGRISDADKQRVVAQAHALLVTSVREGWGLVVSEAAALGTPAVAYDVAGLRDSVTAAQGRLSRPNPRSLADEILAALPRWIVEAPTPLPLGGAASWDHVASAVLHEVRVAARLPEHGTNEQKAGSTPVTTPATAGPRPLIPRTQQQEPLMQVQR
jgi:glycosyltransferase involved in cell wall biosynthesis